MKLKITIDLSNDAFAEAAAQEVQRMLNAMIERLADAPSGGLMLTKIPLRDLNGNRVGEVKVGR